MKKIGITCYPTVGGSGVIATELGKLLADQGYEIHFITSSIPFRLEKIHPKIYYHEVELNHYPVFQYPPYDLALASKMAEVIDHEELDVLHVHYAIPHAVCAILAKNIAERDVKIVTTLHGTDITVLGIDPTFHKMIKYSIEGSDEVTAVSKSLKEQTQEMLNTNKEISVVHNFVNEKQYYRKNSSKLKEQYNIKPEEKVVIHISNFRKVKRVDDVIRSFDIIQSKVDSKLVLVGDGPEYSTAIQLVDELELNEKVLFLGKQSNISELLSISDLILLPSEKESFGLVLLEAMKCRVPGIGTNTGGIPEVIEDKETGFIVNVGDTEAIAAKAIELLTDPEKLQQFSENALKRAENFFHSKSIMNEYLKIYNKK